MEEKKPITYADLKPRYNKVGEWKPLVYSGDISAIGKEVYELTKDEYDKRVYGAIYYIKATSCNVIEFIVKTHFEIPTDFQQMGSQYGKIQLHKIKFKESYANLEGIQVYDGTLELGGIEIEDIKNGLAFIDVSLHRIAFRLNTKVEWFMKYPHHDNDPNGLIKLKDTDMDSLGEYLMSNLGGKDSSMFDIAISWYINGNNSTNSFVRFLSYCIAIESLCDHLLSGKMEISLKYGIAEPEDVKENILKCIREEHDRLYGINPEKFVTTAYFECIGSIQKKLRGAMAIIFGEEHEYVKLFFNKTDKYSIYDLRSKLAHGSFTILDSEDKEIIEKRLPDVKHIAHELILRLSTGTMKDETIKEIATGRTISILFNNPRGTGVASNLDFFQNKDWTIKPEWLF